MGMIFLNGKEYTSSPKDGFPPIIYSDEEREIGVWRDGKPLYQKVFQSTITGDGNNEIASIAGLNADNYYVTEAFLLTSNASIPSGYNNGSNTAYFYVYTRTSDNTIRAISKGYASVVVYIVFRYTKTTDTAGSGKYTTYGGIAHHYSTSEQVVGTWIDGKPLYEKTFLKTLSAIPSGGGAGTAIEGSEIPNCVVRFVKGYCGPVPFNCEYSRSYNGGWEGYANIWGTGGSGGNSVAYNFRWGDTASADAVIVLQYTKTTD